jgi:hypothetical protein
MLFGKPKTRRSTRVKCDYKTRDNKCYDKNKYNGKTRSNRRYRKHSKSYRMKGG